MSIRTPAALFLAGLSLAACATGGGLPPAQVLRYHLGEPIDRGTIRVEPLTAPGVPASIEYKTYAAAVESELLRNGYALAPAGTQPQLIATVSFTRQGRLAPPRRSPVSIGIGGGGFSGGGYRGGGGVGLGGGVGFPIGGGGAREIVETELAVTIKRRVDQSPVWEGRVHGYSDPRRADPQAGDQATRLAGALFAGFPGESGRTIEVK
ncbi:DUF4136 domain-containing protein [Sphingomonas rubra]|uniref:DUF4136 domain-containing protein n=1 Tax=Sphingomonas rubra TaxID=634430 RepID=A0A1I5T998_9SPHN|nr:DUF4136 domain-containing protein [Sphingomonas rubra]SFP79634.1 protein of unknown function [Sphingomonas rubra]